MRPVTQPANECVPEVKRLVHVRVQADRLTRLGRVVRCEQQQFHAGGVFRKYRKIDAFRRHGRPEGMRRALLDR